ncbi:MAG: hypothetical protein WA771_02580 [Chthoniobacterales bacterium]
MKPNLDSLLAAYREREIPELPGSFAQDVLRDIRQRRSAPEARRGWWQEFLEMACRPSRLVAGLSVAIAIGVLIPYTTLPSEASRSVQGLDLAVFSGAARNLPSGLLTRIP